MSVMSSKDASQSVEKVIDLSNLSVVLIQFHPCHSEAAQCSSSLKVFIDSFHSFPFVY